MLTSKTAALALALALALSTGGAEPEGPREGRRTLFNPPPLSDEWNRWFVGEWESTGETDTGSGKGITRVELGLNGQFRIHTEEGVITDMTPEQVQYLKRNMHASDEEIERFRSQPYRAIEIYTTDQVTGETVGYLFDSLRCVATGRGTRDGNRETIEWVWVSGHRSTRITERLNEDRIAVIQRTRMPDGSVMEEKGRATRKKPPSAGLKR